MYTLQVSESQNGKIIRYENIMSSVNFVEVYKNFISLVLCDDSGLYNYRIMEGNKIIEELMEREECIRCAYNDAGSCSCYEKASICCPYAEAEEGD